MFEILNTFALIYPEILLLIGLITAIILSTTKFKNIIWLISIILMISACLYLLRIQSQEKTLLLNGMFIFDPLSTIFKLLTLFLVIILTLGSIKYTNGFVHKTEFLILLLSATISILFLISSNDLITLFVSLETLSLSSIMLSGYSKYDLRSNEASIKYLLNSASASSIFLFGLSIIYGLCRTTQFDEIKFKLLSLDSQSSTYMILSLALILIVSGIAFKLASAPFHMWSPDVYEGSPTPTTAFLATASKLATFAIAIRLLIGMFGAFSIMWQPILIVISILSMVIGNLTALGEVLSKGSIKRLMAYSSIAQIGYILIGLTLCKPETISSSIFYLVIYSIMNLCAFLCIIAFGNETNSDSIPDYAGLVKVKPLLTAAFSICLFNLAGLPIPPAGFIAKFILFKASFEAGTLGIFLAIIALITTILSVFYYSYIVKLMVVDKPSEAISNIGSEKSAIGVSLRLNTAIIISAITIFILSFASNQLLLKTDKITYCDFKTIKSTFSKISIN